MRKEKLEQLLLFMAALNAFVGAAAAKLDPIYFVAGLGTAALFYYARHVLKSDRDSVLKSILQAVSK